MNHQTLFITGGAGFVGSNLAVLFKQRHPSWKIICFDNLKRRGSEQNLPRLRAHGIQFVHGDIRNPEDLQLDEKMDVMIDCAAEPAVLAGMNGNPRYLIDTNLMGTVNFLQLAAKNRADVLFLSTSRVYPYDRLNRLPVNENENRFEWAPVDNKEQPPPGWRPTGVDHEFVTDGPKSLYGATKLCSEIMIHEYRAMFGLRAVINRCGLIAGPWQFGKVDQGVCMYWLLAHYFKRPLSYIGYGGNGKQVRDILHVEDLQDLLEMQIDQFDVADGNVYNVGGGNSFSLSLKEMTALCRQVSSRHISIGSVSETRPMDLKIYLSDNTKAKTDFGWNPTRSPQKVFQDMMHWIKNNETWIIQSLDHGVCN
jgi:CDP-paratose 2-epimerase